MNVNVILEKYLPHSKRARMLILMVVDALAVCVASFLGLFVRFDMNVGRIPSEYIGPVVTYLPIYMAATLIIFFLFRLYAIMWSVAGIREALRIVGACALTTLVQMAGMVLLEHRVPRSFYIICFASLTCMELGIRLSYRILTTVVPQNIGDSCIERRIMIAGAGSSGAVI